MPSRFIPTIASQSLGRAWHHSLEHKLELCAQYGFESIELFYEDLEAVAKSLPSSHPASAAGTSFENSTDIQEQQLAAADYIHELCLRHSLEVLCLQPFMHYEGRLDERSHDAAIARLHFWIKLARRLDTDLIQIPSSFLPASQCTGDRAKIVADLQQVSDIGLQTNPATRFAYEALCWGTHVDTWDDAWSIVLEVDRPNFGTCFDTFNLAGRVFADPASPTGRNVNAEADMQTSILKLRSDLPIALEKVFYVEVCDGERLDSPLLADHEFYHPQQPTRMSWSRNARLFPFEKSGYLPALRSWKRFVRLDILATFRSSYFHAQQINLNPKCQNNMLDAHRSPGKDWLIIWDGNRKVRVQTFAGLILDFMKHMVEQSLQRHGYEGLVNCI